MQNSEKMTGFGGRNGTKELEAVVAEHETALLRYATRIVNDPNAAQDVVQDTFIKLYRGWKSGAKPSRQLNGWLYRVTHNNAVDYIRKENRLRVLHQNQADEVAPATPAHQGNELEKNERMRLALEHLRKLNPDEQQVVVLRLQEGKSYREIAEITKRTEGNIGCILHHAVKKLSKSLNRAGAI